jgi:signal transduction histidine kinase
MRYLFCLWLCLWSVWAHAQEGAVPADSLRARYIRAGVFLQTVRRDYPGALVYYQQMLALDKARHAYKLTLDDYNTILNLYFYMGDYPNAMKTTLEGLALVEGQADSFQMARYYNIQGFIYEKLGDTSQSAYYYNLYLRQSERAHNKSFTADAFDDIGGLQVSGGHYEEALSSLSKAYELYDQVQDTDRLVYTAFKISQAYKGMGKYKQALVYAKRTLSWVDASHIYNEYDKAGYYINAGDIYRGLSDLGNAERMIRQGLVLSQSIQHRENVMEASLALSDIFALKHRYDSAFAYYKQYASLRDSLSNAESRRQIAEMHERYVVDKKDKEIQQKSLERNIFLISTLLLVAFILLLYSRRRLKLRAEREARLNRQKSELFGTIMSVQDGERKRIAQDIHDTLGSILSAAKLSLSRLDKTGLTPVQVQAYQTSLELLDQAAAELRNIARNIMPAGLSKIGLPAAVKGLLDTLGSSPGLSINFHTHGLDERLPEALEISLYRVILELINNVIKHARATRLTVQLVRHPAYINIVVEDDGIGLDPQPVNGIGLNSIISRINYLKGSIDIDSKRGAGTTVLIDIPCT